LNQLHESFAPSKEQMLKRYLTPLLAIQRHPPDAHYFIRMDIKSFYASIPKHKLVSDIKALYDDEKVHHMLEGIIHHPTPYLVILAKARIHGHCSSK